MCDFVIHQLSGVHWDGSHSGPWSFPPGNRCFGYGSVVHAETARSCHAIFSGRFGRQVCLLASICSDSEHGSECAESDRYGEAGRRNPWMSRQAQAAKNSSRTGSNSAVTLDRQDKGTICQARPRHPLPAGQSKGCCSTKALRLPQSSTANRSKNQLAGSGITVAAGWISTVNEARSP